MLRNITLRRVTSTATKRVQAVRFDGERHSVWVRFGWGMCLDELSLVDGRGKGALAAWQLDDGDLDVLRAAAARDGLRLPPKRQPAQAAPKQPAHKPADVDPRQLPLIGGNHGN